MLSVAVALCAFGKKKYFDRKDVGLGTFLGDALTISVVVPFLTLVHATWSNEVSVDEVITQNQVLLTLALLVCTAMMFRIVFFPEGFRAEK